MYEVVEHWWNERWGGAGRHLWLYRDPQIPLDQPGAWALGVRCRAGEDRFGYRTESRVREDLADLLASYGPWRRLRE